MTVVRMPCSMYLVSDGTGGTAEKVVRAALHQFQGTLVYLQVFPNVTERVQLERLVRRAASENALMVTTLVRTDMRAAADEYCKQHKVQTVDLLGDLLIQLGQFLETVAAGIPGRIYAADEEYFRRVEAVEFTVKADDGKEPRMLKDADIVLIGVSRTSKTPLSVFLAHKGFKVSNVPVVLERPLPPEADAIEQRRIFALTIDPDALREIRQQRMQTMRMPGRSNYSEMDYILAELEWAEDLFRAHPTWPVIDVTRKAVEETAANILRIMGERGLGRSVGEVGQL
jgi:regulator of PEP synthase PpsR (kinase-PPPase family)